MKNRHLITAIFMASTAVFGSGNANAAEYIVSYTNTYNNNAENFSAIFTTSDISNKDGFYKLINIKGERDGLAALLLPIGSFGGNDNLFKPSVKYFTSNGISYEVGSKKYNLFSTGNIPLEAGFGNITNFSVSQVTGAVPEPATWAMMLVGFGGIGFAMRRRGKVRTRVSYAA